MKRVLIVGGDMRFKRLAKLMEREYRVYTALMCGGKTVLPDLSALDAAVLPIPYTKDGKHIYSAFSCEKIPIGDITRGIKKDAALFYGGTAASPGLCGFNILKNEEYLCSNARFTAKGVMKLYERELRNGDNALIIGYGRIGGLLAGMLKERGAAVTVAARKASARKAAEAAGCYAVDICCLKRIIGDFGFIINTVPERIICAETEKLINSKCTAVDISSAPHGFEHAGREINGVKIQLEEGLPGRFYPCGEAKSIKRFIDVQLKGE